MQPVVTLTQNDWSLHRKGPIDLARHNAKVKDAIRGDLPAIVGEEAIITADDNKIVKVPIRSLELPHFRFRSGDEPQVGQGTGNSRPGDVIGQAPAEGGPGEPAFRGLTNDDLRCRTWEPTIVEDNNAVIIAMRDVSGSMGEFEKYITRSFYFWMVRFLRTPYANVEIVFITHHTEAREVDEDSFFHLGESGGTRVSSAYQLALDVVHERYDPSAWNVYAFHFSDGDNWGDLDNQRCVELVHNILGVANAFGYGEIREGGPATRSTLMSAFAPIQEERFVRVGIASKEEVYPALRTFFARTPVTT